jgi:competence protein ComEA
MLERYKHLVFGAVIFAILSGVIALVLHRPAPVTVTILPPPPTSTPAPITVYVTGAVISPNLTHTLPAGSRAQDAIDAAGGFSAEADLAGINVAQRLVDGQQIHVPKVGEITAPALVGVLNINLATFEQLMLLPGISAVVANNIIDYREANGPFKSMDDLDQVPQIGPATIAKWQGLIVFE